MIQELFGERATNLLNQDQNLPISGSPSPSPSSSSTTTATATTTTTDPTTVPNHTAPDNQKLRCPRCDSSNTKFCYYNNYNLTQPRHFCKTCRRYWTKGGALRNVPIGGGCRKNKGTTIAAAVGKPISATGKFKAVVSSELGKTGFFNGLEHEFNPNPVLWSGPPQTSHLLSLLRATQNPNPSFTPNPVSHMKDFVLGSNMSTLGFEPLGQTSSLWRNNQVNQNDQLAQHQQGMIMTSCHEVQNQRLRSSYPGSYYNHDQATPLIFGSNVVSTSSSASASRSILDSAPVLASGEPGLWNQTLPWSDLATANGAYP